MWGIVAQMVITDMARQGDELRDARPGAIVRVDNPRSFQRIQLQSARYDCQGCGAPLKAYIHHCEYCRRAK